MCSLEPISLLDGLLHFYRPVEPGSLLPLDFPQERRFLFPDTLQRGAGDDDA